MRRGAEKAEIYSLAFSSNAQWLAASSDKGTVHVFCVKVDAGSLGSDGSHSTSEISRSNPSAISSLSYFKGNIFRYLALEVRFLNYNDSKTLELVILTWCPYGWIYTRSILVKSF